MPRKIRFETVPVAEIAHLVAQEATAPAPTILSISCNRDLLMTRELILAQAGYRVSSVFKLEEAIRECAHQRFDLLMIGHSFLDEEQGALEFLCQAVGNAGSSTASSSGREKNGATPVLLLRRPEDPRLQGADYELDPLSGPEALLELVSNILRRAHATAVRPGG